MELFGLWNGKEMKKQKIVFTCLMVWSCFQGFGQIKITGDVINPGLLNLNEFKTKRVSSNIKNHVGVSKKKLKNSRGVQLTEAIAGFILSDSIPKNYSKYIYTIIAKDGYFAVFSWNELYNNRVGKKVYLINQSNSHPKDGLLLISKSDRYTGRRFVKDVVEIHIERK